METERIEYLRKNDRWNNKSGKYKSRGVKRGVLFCGVSPINANAVVVGFSLCNSVDRFDYLNGQPQRGFGLELANSRADKWENHEGYFTQLSFPEQYNWETDKIFYKVNPDPKRFVEIPPSIEGRLKIFINRCKRYYKDKIFPEWVEKFILDEEIECEIDDYNNVIEIGE